MAKVYEKIEEKHRAFIAAQHMFFISTAPLDAMGHVNVSPKGYDSFVILDDHTVAYLDLGGSGIETQAHLQENGRITVMFCAFEGKANILRLYGRGAAIDFNNSEFESLRTLFPQKGNARAVIKIHVSRVQDSCGYGVPFYDFVGPRDQLERSLNHMSEADYQNKRMRKNAYSIDGLTGLGQGTEHE